MESVKKDRTNFEESPETVKNVACEKNVEKNWSRAG